MSSITYPSTSLLVPTTGIDLYYGGYIGSYAGDTVAETSWDETHACLQYYCNCQQQEREYPICVTRHDPWSMEATLIDRMGTEDEDDDEPVTDVTYEPDSIHSWILPTSGWNKVFNFEASFVYTDDLDWEGQFELSLPWSVRKVLPPGPTPYGVDVWVTPMAGASGSGGGADLLKIKALRGYIVVRDR